MANSKQKANILVVGPANSGKTTFLNTLSMTPIIEVDYRSDAQLFESDLTGGVEYGAYLTPDLEVELRALPCSSPAGDGFDMNWEVASEHVDAVMMLVPSDDPKAFLEAQRMLDTVAQKLDVPFLLAMTRSDEGLAWNAADVADCFEIPEEFVVTLDPREYQAAFRTLNNLFEYISLEPAEAVEEDRVLAIA